MNAGLCGARNLAWKLAAVQRGEVGCVSGVWGKYTGEAGDVLSPNHVIAKGIV
jgi:hypothetical protein